jgi:hypothetical protein
MGVPDDTRNVAVREPGALCGNGHMNGPLEISRSPSTKTLGAVCGRELFVHRPVTRVLATTSEAE